MDRKLRSNTFYMVFPQTNGAVTRRDNLGGGGGGGGGVHIHIVMFTNRKNNRFQKKSVGQNTNI
jgi:hypothetical protein